MIHKLLTQDGPPPHTPFRAGETTYPSCVGVFMGQWAWRRAMQKICRRDGCDNIVHQKGKKSYCCKKCSIIQNKADHKALRAQIDHDILIYQRKLNHPKLRICLGADCGKEFHSLGPWNRLCPKCKVNQVDDRLGCRRAKGPGHANEHQVSE